MNIRDNHLDRQHNSVFLWRKKILFGYKTMQRDGNRKRFVTEHGFLLWGKRGFDERRQKPAFLLCSKQPREIERGAGI